MRAEGREETCDVSLRLGLPAGMTAMEPSDRKAKAGCAGGRDSVGFLASSIHGSEKKKKQHHQLNLSFSHGTVLWDEAHMSDSKESQTGVMGACSSRKKLKLTRDQAKLLEECFKWSHSLDPVQKQELARRLNLRPRQVEVWFQNRRARTKMKQTEKDREMLRRCCESLREENRRLRIQLAKLRSGSAASRSAELRSGSAASRSAALTICPSCHGCGPEAAATRKQLLTAQAVQYMRANLP